MEPLQHSDSFGIQVQGAHFLQAKALPPSKTKGQQVYSNANINGGATYQDASHLVSMSSSKFRGAPYLQQASSIAGAETVSQNADAMGGDTGYSGQFTDLQAQFNAQGQPRRSPLPQHTRNFSLPPRGQNAEASLCQLIGVQKMDIGYQELVAPVNYDKKKSRRKYGQPSPSREGKDAQVLNTIENQPSVSNADGSFFTKKNSLDRSAESRKGPVSQMNGRGNEGTPLQGGAQKRVERFNEAAYGRSPLRFGQQRSDYYDHNVRRAHLGASHERGARGNTHPELEEFSEFNQSLKMSIQHPIYSGSLPSKEAGGTRQHIQVSGKLPLRQSRLGGGDGSPHQASLNTQFDPAAALESEAQAAQIKFLEIKRFVFQLDNIIEFCEDDASDVPTILRMIEQCLNRKVHLNKQHLTVPILKKVTEQVVENVDNELGIRNMSATDLEAVEACLKKGLTRGIQQQVKVMMREYLSELARTEKKEEIRESKAGQRGAKGSLHGTIDTVLNAKQAPSVGGVHDSFDAADPQQITTEGQMQHTLEAPEGPGSHEGEKESELPTDLVTPEGEEAQVEELAEDPTVQRHDDTGSDPDDEEEDGGSPHKYLLDEELEELEQIQNGGDVLDQIALAELQDPDQMDHRPIRIVKGQRQGGSDMPDLDKYTRLDNVDVSGVAPFKPATDSVNEIIVKIEMKKFQNLINNRLQRKNNLVSSDVNRIYPLNKVTDGSARPVEVISGFQEGLLKVHPKLFPYYEKINKKSKQAAQEKAAQLLSTRKALKSLSPPSRAQIPPKEAEADQNGLYSSKTQVCSNVVSQKSFLAPVIPSTSHDQRRTSLLANGGGQKAGPPQTAHQMQRGRLGDAGKRRSQGAWGPPIRGQADHQGIGTAQRSSFERFQTLSLNSKLSGGKMSGVNPSAAVAPSVPSAGVAGKRQPTTYVVNEIGDIGVIQQEDKHGAIGTDKRAFAHERTLSQFAQSHLSKANGANQSEAVRSLATASGPDRKLFLSMPPLQSAPGTQRQRSMQQHYKPKTVKNKYGLNVPDPARSNLNNSQSMSAASHRLSLAQKYRIPADNGGARSLLDSSRIGLGSTLGESARFLSEEESAEPFGWKIGLKDRAGPYHEEVARQKHERHLQQLRNQKRQQQHLQRGIDKLTHNQFYRQMYEKFKDGQSKYPNELARILTEDCPSGTIKSTANSAHASRSELGQPQNPIKKWMKQGQN